MKRTEKIALLQSLLSGNASKEQVKKLQQTGEPMRVTLKLDEGSEPEEPQYPQFCIDVYTDGSTRSYDRYEDGTEIDR